MEVSSQAKWSGIEIGLNQGGLIHLWLSYMKHVKFEKQ